MKQKYKKAQEAFQKYFYYLQIVKSYMWRWVANQRPQHLPLLFQPRIVAIAKF